MDSSIVIISSLCATGAGTVLWWMFRNLHSRIDACETRADASEKAFSEFKLYCAQTYVTDDHLGKAIEAFNRSIDAVFSKLNRIEEKLDKKADK